MNAEKHPRVRILDVPACSGCGKAPLSSGRHITFHRVTVQRAVLDHQAARISVGLELQFAGRSDIAQVFSPHAGEILLPAELTHENLTVCEDCAASKSLWEILEAHNDREEAERVVSSDD